MVDLPHKPTWKNPMETEVQISPYFYLFLPGFLEGIEVDG